MESDFLILIRNVGLVYCEVKRNNLSQQLAKAAEQIDRVKEMMDILSQANTGCDLPCVKVTTTYICSLYNDVKDGFLFNKLVERETFIFFL